MPAKIRMDTFIKSQGGKPATDYHKTRIFSCAQLLA